MVSRLRKGLLREGIHPTCSVIESTTEDSMKSPGANRKTSLLTRSRDELVMLETRSLRNNLNATGRNNSSVHSFVFVTLQKKFYLSLSLFLPSLSIYPYERITRNADIYPMKNS